MTKIQIGKHEVGSGCKPFIVAEVGSNWESFEDCKNSIVLAKSCGADAVKFQLFTPESMYGQLREGWDLTLHEKIGVGLVQSGWDCIPPYLNPAWLPLLKEKADACGIEFMCSAFSPELIDAVDPYVNVHKVASAELTHIRMLEKLRTIGKPVILSTGASGEQDIRNALEVLGDTPVILMYCVAAYPAREVNLESIRYLATNFRVPVGYSDHTLDVCVIPRAANLMGASVIEKHFTGVPELESPDRGHSLTASQFKRMVESIRGNGTNHFGASAEENPMILRHNRRLLATREIAVGDTLKEGENFGIYRSLKDDTCALSPWCIDQVNGRKAAVAIHAGDGIGPGAVA